MTIYDYPQWITWKPVPVLRPDGSTKTDKKPWDYARGYETDPHNPAFWSTHAAAASSGHPIGFVFTTRDPYFFLDLDRCRVGSGWRPEAAQIVNYFAGSARELSQSQNGIHIVGQCDKLALSNRKNKFGKEWVPELGLWIEFYITGRFMALGHGFEGNFDLNWTAALAAWLPIRPVGEEGVALQAGPVPEYTGPVDDAELISKALASRGSISAVFGNKATFETLWFAKPEMLAQHYPSQTGDTYDRSSADAALFAHLAFWTGKDAARMDRLFRQSGLMRDKYRDREPYRLETIRKAVGGCSRVYDVIRSATAPVIGATAAIGSDWLTIPEQEEYFAGCVYILDQHRVLTPTGYLMKPEQFNAYYGGKNFVMSIDGDGATKKAWEAFTENRAHRFPKVKGTCFRPLASPGAIIDDRVNIYRPFEPKRTAGDPSPFLNHVAKMLPNERDRAILFHYMASVVQRPGLKMQWAPVIQGAEGNGKTILTNVLEQAAGLEYSHRPSAEDLANPFNSYLENKLFIAVEEIYTEGRRELLDTLKPLITNERVETQPKGVDKRMVENWANWLFLTNHKDAVPVSIDGRRYCVMFCAQQDADGIVRDGMNGDYFPNLYAWLRGGGYEVITNWLLEYVITLELDPVKTIHRAPETSTTPQARALSLGKVEQEINEAVESEDKGFRNGWISSYRVEILCREKGLRVGRSKLGEILENMGYKKVERATSPLLHEDQKRPILYVQRTRYDGTLNTSDYCRAQGYDQQFRQTVIPMFANQNG